jgi:exoribonuclease R
LGWLCSGAGSVIRILERKRKQIVGTLQRGRQFLYARPDDPRKRLRGLIRRYLQSGKLNPEVGPEKPRQKSFCKGS